MTFCKLHCFIHYNVHFVVYIVPYILCITLYIPKLNYSKCKYSHIFENFLLPYMFQTFIAFILI